MHRVRDCAVLPVVGTAQLTSPTSVDAKECQQKDWRWEHKAKAECDWDGTLAPLRAAQGSTEAAVQGLEHRHIHRTVPRRRKGRTRCPGVRLYVGVYCRQYRTEREREREREREKRREGKGKEQKRREEEAGTGACQRLSRLSPTRVRADTQTLRVHRHIN